MGFRNALWFVGSLRSYASFPSTYYLETLFYAVGSWVLWESICACGMYLCMRNCSRRLKTLEVKQRLKISEATECVKTLELKQRLKASIHAQPPSHIRALLAEAKQSG